MSSIFSGGQKARGLSLLDAAWAGDPSTDSVLGSLFWGPGFIALRGKLPEQYHNLGSPPVKTMLAPFLFLPCLLALGWFCPSLVKCLLFK